MEHGEWLATISSNPNAVHNGGLNVRFWPNSEMPTVMISVIRAAALGESGHSRYRGKFPSISNHGRGRGANAAPTIWF
jgi:hypothetical protein